MGIVIGGVVKDMAHKPLLILALVLRNDRCSVVARYGSRRSRD